MVFPDPANVAITSDEIRYITLKKLIELKLASGMTNPGRMNDLADVQEMIKSLDLQAEFTERLHPSVRWGFEELRLDAVEG